MQGTAATLIRDQGPGSSFMEKLSVFKHSYQEAQRHKWIESQRAGRDLGDEALHAWVKLHWNGFLRARWLEHLEGKMFWQELDRGDFALFQWRFDDQQRPLLNQIVDRLKAAKENLDLILWARENGIPMHEVIDILFIIDINSRRLEHRFDPVQ
jgi:hypothetical protein